MPGCFWGRGGGLVWRLGLKSSRKRLQDLKDPVVVRNGDCRVQRLQALYSNSSTACPAVENAHTESLVFNMKGRRTEFCEIHRWVLFTGNMSSGSRGSESMPRPKVR